MTVGRSVLSQTKPRLAVKLDGVKLERNVSGGDHPAKLDKTLHREIAPHHVHHSRDNLNIADYIVTARINSIYGWREVRAVALASRALRVNVQRQTRYRAVSALLNVKPKNVILGYGKGDSTSPSSAAKCGHVF